MRKLLIPILLCLVSFSFAQDLKFKKGTVIDSVAIVNDTLSESYAIYLPKNFNLEKKWPVVFIFDPKGVGKNGVAVFAEAAEKYGYILIGSNNIIEDKLQPNLRIYSRLSKEIISIFPVDLSRVYTAGFSGGARIASSIAVISPDIGGVIANSGGFSSQYLPKKNTFSFVGIAGDTDFNYLELLNTTSFLRKRKFDAEFYTFKGDHDWAPSSLIVRVFDGIELKRNIKSDINAGNDFIREIYRKDYETVKTFLKDEDPVSAVEELTRMQRNYRLSFDIDSLKNLITTIRKDKVLRNKLVSQRNAINLERTIRFDYLESFNADMEEIVMDNLAWWEDQMITINGYINSPNIATQNMGKRIRNMLYVLGKETAKSLDKEKDKQQLLYLNIFSTLVNPKGYEAYFSIMQSSVKANNYEMALYYAEELFINGFKDRDQLYALEGLSLLRISPEFRALVTEYLK